MRFGGRCGGKEMVRRLRARGIGMKGCEMRVSLTAASGRES